MVRRAQLCLLLTLFGCAAANLAAQPTGSDMPDAAPGRPTLPGVQPPPDVAPPKPTPALPGSKTAADTFRELLELTPEARNQALADQTEHQRRYIETRLREYQALPRPEREARLQQLDLTCHLNILMRLPPDRREDRIANVPSALRPLVDERLRQWDQLPPSVQESVLEYETTANYFFRVRPAAPAPRQLPPNPLDPAVSRPGGRAGKIMQQFSQFIELPVKEQQKVLEILPPSERENMESALKTYARLGPEQRRRWMTSLEKFSRMSKPEHEQFLRNAARWKAMSPAERETWRSLVSTLPPPIPSYDAVRPSATASNHSTSQGPQ